MKVMVMQNQRSMKCYKVLRLKSTYLSYLAQRFKPCIEQMTVLHVGLIRHLFSLEQVKGDLD